MLCWERGKKMQSRLSFIYPWQAQKWWGIKTEIKSNHDRVEALSLQRRSSQIGGKLNNVFRHCKIVSKYLKILQCNANETWQWSWHLANRGPVPLLWSSSSYKVALAALLSISFLMQRSIYFLFWTQLWGSFSNQQIINTWKYSYTKYTKWTAPKIQLP